MIKRYAFALAFFIVAVFVLNFFSFKAFSISEQERETAQIARVIDGDTLKLSDGRTVRLLNINSPEKGTRGANLSAEFLRSFENKTIELEITGTDKYKRNLARIYTPNYINLEIVEKGLASKFLVQESELKKFSKAEESAIKNSLGIWEKSGYSGCFGTFIDKINEESRKIYTFKNLTIGMITLHSGSGSDNSTDIFWNSRGDIWNNDRDSSYLFDSGGGIAQYESYGY